MDEVLNAHRARVDALRDSLERLLGLHAELYERRAGIVRRGESGEAEAAGEIDALRGEVERLTDQVRQVRSRAFGEIPHKAELMLSQTVESAEPIAAEHTDFVPEV